MKKITPPLDSDGDYTVDALVGADAPLPAPVQTAIRNLLLAVELGAIVVVQCTRVSDNGRAFVLCAWAETPNGDDRLLPICELGQPVDMKAAFRPPSVIGDKTVANPHFSDDLTNLVKVDDGVQILCTPVTSDEDKSVH